MAVSWLVPVSIVVPARDEAARIADFVRQHAWADEVIVVDHGSRDDTAQAARTAGARVVHHEGGTIGDARNAGADAASHSWIFALDADEVAEPEIGEEIRTIISAPTFEAYRLRRRNFFLGREQKRGLAGRDKVVRLYRQPLRWNDRLVHERLEFAGPLGELTASLVHESYRDLAHHFDKVNRYGAWGAQELHRAGKHAGVGDLLGRPMWGFFRAYVINGGILDGRFGLVTALLGAQSTFMKYAHLWALDRRDVKTREASRGGPP